MPSLKLNRTLLLRIGVTLAVSLALGLGCISIEMSPESDEQLAAASEQRADEYRARWADQFSRSTPYEQASMVASTVEGQADNLIGYGYRVFEEWRATEGRAGRPVGADEIQPMVDEGIREQIPVLQGYSEALKYGLYEINRRMELQPASIELLQQAVDLYEKVRKTVLDLEGSADDYEHNIDLLKLDLTGLVPEIREDLRGLR